MLPAEQFTPEPLGMPNEHLAAEEIDTKPSRVHIETKGSDSMDHVRSCSNRDKSVVHTLKELGSGVNLQGDEWEEHDGLVLEERSMFRWTLNYGMTSWRPTMTPQ